MKLARLLLAVCFVPLAQAWDSPGHIMVAKIGYDNASAAARKKIDELSKSDELAILNPSTKPALHYNGVNFAAWPDDIKHATPDATKYAGRYGNWHFMDMSITADPLDAFKDLTPPGLKSGDAYTGLHLCLDVLKGKKSDVVPNEAVALALLVHLLGDIHQPLHCATRFLSPPDAHGRQRSDAGGNSVTIQNFENKYPELHQLWDTGALSTFDVAKKAVTVPGDFPTFGTTNTSPALLAAVEHVSKGQKPADTSLADDYLKRWILESHKLAVDVAYGKAGNLDKLPLVVTKAYVDQVNTITERQIYVAGMRLAQILKEIYP